MILHFLSKTSSKRLSSKSYRLYTTKDVSDRMCMMLYRAKYNAKQRERKGRKKCGEFTIDKDTIVTKRSEQGDKCAYTNLPFNWTDKGVYDIPSIDRIDSDKGYTDDNVQLVQWRINQMKNDMSEDDFLNYIEKIYLNKLG